MNADRTQALEQLRRAVALQRLQKRGTAIAANALAPPIEHADRNGRLPLSWAQQRLWFLDQLDHAAGAAYHMSAALRLTGTLDRKALRATLDRIVARHENLRTTFVSTKGAPDQVIAPADIGFTLLEHDLRGLDADARESSIAELQVTEFRAPFDLARGPLIRGRLLQLAESEYILLLTQHHIVSDGWSLNVLVKEVTALYTAFSQGQPDPLPELEIQYADYSAWQREWLEGDVLQSQLDFWRSHLGGAPAMLELPIDLPRPPMQSYAGNRVAVNLSRELTQRLHALSQAHGTTLFMTLMAAWGALLSRLSGQTNVVVGTPVAGRQRTQIESLIGFFVNTLALRIDLDEAKTVAELLAQVRANTLDAYANQDVPFDQVVEVLQPGRDMSYSPVFQAMFAFNNTPGGRALKLPGLELEGIVAPRHTANFALELALSEEDGVVGGSLGYTTDLFLHPTIERFAAYFTQLLEGMVADDQATIARLPLMPTDEREQVLTQFNATSADFARDSTIHALFEQWAQQQPEATALVFGRTSLSYAELNRRANQVAHRLIAMGVKPDDRVAICTERGPEMVIGLLGILKAGGAYVPLDPEYPADRLAFMLGDSAPVVLLTESMVWDAMPELGDAGVPIVTLDDLASRPQFDANPALELTPGNLAYVIYTSGSTGVPKGVMVEHHGACNLVAAQGATFDVRPDSRVLQFASFSFDASVFEVVMALCSGAALHLASREALRPVEPLINTLRNAGTTHVTLPPSVLATLADHDLGLPGLTIIAAGEALPPALARQWSRQAKIYNAYGPTETTVWATVHPCTTDETQVPIGRPIANTQVYLLDANRNPVPMGVTGEIYIAGAGLARGYLKRPELTAERFVANPFGAEGSRMYRTGDLGRWLPNGEIEYLGRNDFQVKLRGFRIELGEIESRLLTCAGVREAAVTVREDTPGDKRLVAYIVGRDGAQPTANDLREALAREVAEYMIPSAFVSLDALPVTPNGKVDRKALPAPDQSARSVREYEAPAGEVERAVAEVWQELLGVERVGRRDHFFELGGHSLLVIELIERLRRRGLVAEVRTVFSAPTLEGLAALVATEATADVPGVPPNLITAQATAITPDLLPLVSLNQDEIDAVVTTVPGGVANVQDIYPLAPLQQGILFHHLLEEGGGDTYLLRSVVTFDSRQRMDAFVDALQIVIGRHDILRTAMRWQGLAAPVQVVYRHAPLPVHELTLSADEPALPQLLARTDPRHTRLDLQQAPILAAHAAFDPSSNEWLLALSRHHVVCDHITMELILGEIQLLLMGRGDELSAPVPYRNFIAHMQTTPESVHEAYFREQLGDIEEPTAPFGVLDVQDAGAQLDEVRLPLSASLAKAIRDCSRQHGVTPAVLFHVAWGQVLAQCSGRDDVVFGTVVSGRLQGSENAGQVVGMFINTLPIRVPLTLAVGDAVRETYRRLGELLEHEQAPLSLAQRCSGIPAPLPLFTTLLNYRHSHAEADEAVSTSEALMGIQEIRGMERTNYPLTMSVDDLGEGFSFAALAVPGIDGMRMMRYLEVATQSLVDALANQSGRTMRQLAVLPPEERAQLVSSFGAAVPTSYPQEATLHSLFEAQVARTPDAIALVCEGRTTSYAELNRRANQLAHHLRTLGVQPDERVGLCVDRNESMLVALLAVLKAGGAYVPLDPAYPSDRLGLILGDALPKVVLTDGVGAPVLQRAMTHAAFPQDAVVLDLHADAAQWSQASVSDPDPATIGLGASNLCYLMYTSGSTGRPKGVALEHRSAVNLIVWSIQTFSAEDLANTLFSTSINFDLSVFEYAAPLAMGGTVTLVANALTLLAGPLPVTLINTVPSAMNELTRANAVPPSVRLVNLCGEVLKQTLGERILASANVERLCNLYGPSETTTYSTFTIMDRDSGFITDVGKPLSNTRIYVLDAHDEPVPVGVVGEVWIGGDGVARGYFGQPALTAERFVRDPFVTEAGARMYRTGDLGRWTAQGTLELLGRNDFQVKIRGFRIELGEIEVKLAACDGVREVVVIAREDVPGDKRLVAYVVAQDGVELSIEGLREALARDLPQYMVPSAFVTLDNLPLTPNGKLDRKALPSPDQSAVLSRDYVAPESGTERTIAAIWQELLGLERVGRHDHFFELGGHSLLVIALIERLRQSGLSADVRMVFATPSLSELAARLDGAGERDGSDEVPPNLITTDTAVITPELLPLVKLTQQEIDAIAAEVPEGTSNIQDIYPLGPLQEGILFHHLLESDSVGDTYLLRSVVSFDSRERVDAFIQALQAVIDRHDILRSAMHWKGLPQPVQVVQRRAPLPVHELGLTPDRAALDQMMELTDPRGIRLDLTRAPIIAAYVGFDAANGEWLMSVLIHHIVEDHYSKQLMLREAGLLLQGQGARLPAPMPYRNFIARTHGVRDAEHEAYFREQLGDIDEPTAPFGVLEQQVDGLRVDEDRMEFSDSVAQRIREMARRSGVTPSVLFHVAWAQVLAQTSGRDDVVFGTVLTGRLQGSEGADQVVGMFINTLPIRVPVAQASIGEAVQDTYRRLSALLEHEQASLALAQRCSAIQPPLPLFTALLNYRNRRELRSVDESAIAEQDAAWEGMRLVGGDARNNYPLTMSVEDRGHGFGLTLLSVDGIDGPRVVRYMATAVEALVAALEAGGTTPLQRLSVLPLEEREQVLIGFNSHRTNDAHDRTIHSLFEAQAAAHPDAEALRYEGQSLSYAELNRRANQVAHKLLALGVQPDERVAVCTERSLAMIVGVLGVLKAGAAYVPVDPSYPSDRIAYMLSDSRPKAVLTQAALVPTLPGSDAPVLVIDDGSLEGEGTDNPGVAGLTSRHLAYVIYTSGSTGQPKGVMVEHRSAVNFWRVMGQTTHRELAPHSRVALNAAFSFDMSLKGILQLLSGHCLVLIPQELRANGPAMINFLEQEKIAALDSTPSQLEVLLQAGLLEPTGPRPVSVYLGGEPVGRVLWERLKASPVIHFHNMYGPTECTVDATIGSIRESAGGPVIGRPIANTPVYVLDAHGEPVPVGVAGELFLGGVQVARGYLDRPELTAERFVRDPFSNVPDARMYKTGDLGRWLPDGTLEYLGRNDFQVKIRGFRIELGEIEARLRECIGVREAAVLAREDNGSEKRLVAYVVAEDANTTLSVSELREQLSRELAEFMVPSAFVQLEKLPLTPNGKLDRKALPAPDQSAVASRAYEAPVGEVEQVLAGIWQELLGLERVGRHDHFFELGGHSLLVMQLVIRVRDQFHVELPLRDLFEQPVLSNVADAIRVMQLEAFMGEELGGMQDELDSLSEEELRQLLEEEAVDE